MPRTRKTVVLTIRTTPEVAEAFRRVAEEYGTYHHALKALLTKAGYQVSEERPKPKVI